MKIMQQSCNRILSGEENTPEFRGGLKIARNNGKGGHEEYKFFTTWGHVVTKILDMNLSVLLPDGTKYCPFTTVGEVKTFFRVDNDSFGKAINIRQFMNTLSDFYRQKVEPLEREALKQDEKTVRDFFEANVWGALQDTDSIGELFREIENLASMGIEDVTHSMCRETVLWTAAQIFGNSVYTMVDEDDVFIHFEKELLSENQDLKNGEILVGNFEQYALVKNFNRQSITDYFVDVVVTYPARRKGRAFSQAEEITRRIKILVLVGDTVVRDIGSNNIERRMRNTKYL